MIPRDEPCFRCSVDVPLTVRLTPGRDGLLRRVCDTCWETVHMEGGVTMEALTREAAEYGAVDLGDFFTQRSLWGAYPQNWDEERVFELMVECHKLIERNMGRAMASLGATHRPDDGVVAEEVVVVPPAPRAYSGLTDDESARIRRSIAEASAAVEQSLRHLRAADEVIRESEIPF